jgi:hypothetical protein
MPLPPPHPAATRPRVALFARVTPGSWTTHYVNAFRAVCDARVIGPVPDAATLRRLARDTAQADMPAVDVPCDFENSPPFESLWPAGWKPDLVVGIAPLGVAGLHPGVHLLRCPTAFLSIDTWQCLGDYEDARRYDAVFCAQREFVPHLRAAGARHVFWLPLACDPAAHYPVPGIAPTHDIAFAGSTTQPVHARRRALLETLEARYTVRRGENVFGDDLCQLQARGRLAFNHCAVQEVNMRVFEALAMGRPLLCNRDASFNGLLDLFNDGVHLQTYTGAASLNAAVQALLGDPERAAHMAAAGRAEVLARHTYRHRVRALLHTVAGLVAGSDAQWQPSAAPLLDAPDSPGGISPANRIAARDKGESLLAYLPTLPGVVLDFGLDLGASKHALRRHAAHALHGLAWDAPKATARRGSYNTLWTWPDTPPPGSVDTIALANRPASPLGLEVALRLAHTLLAEGGTLVWRIYPADLDAAAVKPAPGAFGQWLAASDFIVRSVGPPLPDGSCVVQARKRTRRTRDIVQEVLTRLELPALDIAALVERIPAIY